MGRNEEIRGGNREKNGEIGGIHRSQYKSKTFREGLGEIPQKNWAKMAQNRAKPSENSAQTPQTPKHTKITPKNGIFGPKSPFSIPDALLLLTTKDF